MTPRLVQAGNVRHLFHKDNLNAQDERGYTCLHWLVVTGNDRPLRNVLRQGADPTLRDARGLTALDRACKLGRLGMVQALVRAYPGNLFARRESDGRTPLHFANESMQASNMVTLLLELGADVNAAASRTGRTILHESILRGGCTAQHLSILLAYGANVHARDVHGWTALHYASFLGHVDVVQQLLLYGANPTVVDHAGRTPLHVTARKVMLTPWDVDVDAVVSHRMHGTAVVSQKQQEEATTTTTTYEEWSRKFGRRTSAEIVDLLLEHGATSWVTDNEGNLPFFQAAAASEVDVTFEILQVAAMEGLFG